jgi:hypothetical protein
LWNHARRDGDRFGILCLRTQVCVNGLLILGRLYFSPGSTATT